MSSHACVLCCSLCVWALECERFGSTGSAGTLVMRLSDTVIEPSTLATSTKTCQKGLRPRRNVPAPQLVGRSAHNACQTMVGGSALDHPQNKEPIPRINCSGAFNNLYELAETDPPAHCGLQAGKWGLRTSVSTADSFPDFWAKQGLSAALNVAACTTQRQCILC